MEELSAVGEQVFDAECILNKRMRKGKLEFLVKWRGWSSKEQEKELLLRKRGKRPRGRPRKILVSLIQKMILGFTPKSSSSSSGSSSSSSDSSSSCSSSSSSSDDDDEDDQVKQVSPSVRTRELNPVPQKKAQIVMAKQEPPKKRSRKPLPSEVKEFQQNKGPRKTAKDTDIPGAIKKPVHPASFTFMGFHRGSARDTVGGPNRSSLAQVGAVKNSLSSVGSGRPSVQPSSLPLNKSSQSRNVTESKLPVSGMSSGTSLDLKAAPSKSKGVAALNLNTSKHPIQGTTQHTLSSPNGQKKPPAPVTTAQRIPGAKTAASLPSNVSSNQGLQPLNLQNKLVQSNDAPGNGTAPASGPRNAANPARKPVTQNQECKPPKRRLERSGVHKSPTEAQSQQDRSASKDGKKAKMNEMSTGEEESSSDSDQDSSYAGQVAVQSQDWKPTRSLIEHVFVTDVTANLVTVTVKESPTSVGFFSIRNC
uniref:Chromobox homolog 2 (Drosophila Pc class) n=1 Tax=Neolamprologus brichardi TaxID=32507 RepID=A0A3Q4MKQ3_NEOBR